ncbi:hypothetical protein EDE12_1011239 [Methylosinus sp. sav-2]|uniref:hypothetical protein n=1 Tax=Methylosinus sp. sav-2 TaxID=2485168 RepID=UPI00047B5279|nr:hypothetical protein [Methylosinus sp. sav-2]TDX67687.1 hypothetical protein EDE12_1011239 [Methylosinus sp. sav-2]
MTPAQFHASLAATTPPALSPPLLALWKNAKGDWDGAHKCVDTSSETDAMWVHAFLHRAEGDLGNAAYWYARAGKPSATGPLGQEFEAILAALLGR